MKDNKWHCKIKYSYTNLTLDIKGAKSTLLKSSIKLCFDNEPSNYEIETKVIRWVEGLDREIDFAKLKFEEILSWRRLKVVKAASDGQLEEMGYFI
jgi:hypothetical protein|tara:strand:+ start:20 stop:307 length:288 start_codon:yes stop_codon:yes gene_type:complete